MNKVSLVRCESYDYKKVKESIEITIENLGGLEKYIKKGERVLLKPNLLMKRKPEDATTTHPTFIKALAEILIDYGCEVIIGDSPGGPFNEIMLKGIYRSTGMEKVANETGAKLNRNYNSQIKDIKNGYLLKKIVLVDMLNDVDKVISVSKLKTHGMMTYTGAVKNMFGMIPGVKKAEFHLNMPKHDDFANALIDICMCANPVLSFMDGIEAMEGAGPSSGTTRHVNVVIGSDSPYHLDKVAACIINLKFSRVPTIRQCIRRGIVENGIGDIEFTGGQIQDFFVRDFKIPKTKVVVPQSDKMPKFVKKLANNHIQPRPVFNYKKCIRCGICAKNCPAKVIKMKNRPVVNLHGCIRCYCCQELCPKKAINIHRPMILKLILKE